jgi:hypothetical protein
VIVGEWRGTGPCDGGITFRSDGSFDRRHYSPGGYHVAGAWSIHGDGSSSTLTLTCEESDDQDAVGRVSRVKLVRLDAKELIYQFENAADNHSHRYERDVTAAQRQ